MNEFVIERDASGNKIKRQLTDAEQAARDALSATTVADVKAEAGRRILLILQEHEQRNLLALKAKMELTVGYDPTQWPQDMQDKITTGLAAFAQIEAIRTRSNEIEAMDPIPADVTDNALWGVE